MTSDRHILLIAVGPVQPFIAAARKIRDLWAGSQMLEAMSKAVALALHEGDCTFVFPQPDRLTSDLDRESDFGMANKILAVTRPGAALEILVASARKAFKDELKLQFAKLVEQLREHDVAHCVDLVRLDEQSTDYGEFYAVWVPCPEGGYDAARRRAEALLAARKMARTFLPQRWEQTVKIDGERKGLPKNSLDGARETVLLDVRESSPLVRGTDRGTACHTIKRNEHLDALGLLKRWHGLHSEAAKKVKFQTLSDIALVPYLTGIAKRTDLGKLLETAETALQALAVGEGERRTLLYQDRLVVALKDLGLENDKVGQDARSALRKLHAGTGEPPTYACIFHGDGDRMGKALRSLPQQEQHQAFSKALAGFAENVGGIIDQAGGSLIYSGGDDVLAFLPLHTALNCAIEIRECFTTAMQSAHLPMKPVPTFSAGLAIVHHLESLHVSLETARRAERIAKGVERIAKAEFEKDTLVIIQCMRGGGELIVGGKWGPTNPPDASPVEPIARLVQLVDLFQQQEIAGRLAYRLRTIPRTLGSPDATFDFRDNDDFLANAAAAEALRITNADKEESANKDVQKLLIECGDLRIFSDELVVAQQIARVATLAKGDFK